MKRTPFDPAQNATEKPAPKPKRFPVSLDEFLRLAVGGKYKGVRLAEYRKFLRWQVPIQKAVIRTYKERISEAEALRTEPPATLDEVVAIIERRRRDGISEENYPSFFETFTRWRQRQRKERGKHAADARWSQARRMKANAHKLDAVKDALLT